MTDDTVAADLEFDGSSKGNPGDGGYGFVLVTEGNEFTDSGYIGSNITNNVAEYTALVRGLERAQKESIGELSVNGDSELIIKQMTGEYGVHDDKLIPLYQRASNIASEFETIEFTHMSRENNKKADDLASNAAEQN